MEILKLVLMTVPLIVYLGTASTAWGAFTTARVNRHSFRHVFTFSLVASMQVLIYFYTTLTQDDSLMSLRYQCFFVQEILLFAFLTFPMKNRKKELFIRALFYFALMVTIAYWHWAFDMAKILIFIYLATNSKHEAVRNYMSIALGVFVINYLTFYYSGIDSFLFILTGVFFALAYGYTIKKLYIEEVTTNGENY